MLIVFLMSLSPISDWRLAEWIVCTAHASPGSQVSRELQQL